MTKFEVTRETEIEDLPREVPQAVTYLMKKRIRCLSCGEPIWGSLESAAKEKGFRKDEINQFVKDLNDIATKN